MSMFDVGKVAVIYVWQWIWLFKCLCLTSPVDLIVASMCDAVARALAHNGWKPGALAHEGIYVWRVACALVHNGLCVVPLRTRPHLWLRCLCRSLSLLPLSSSPSLDAMWICCALLHKALSSDTRHSSSPIVVVIVAVARQDIKMPCACSQGLVVDIRHHHRHSCCHSWRRAL